MNKRPNILFILTDDQGAWAMHCAGNTDLHTPNLDRLAAEGTRFENFFCASPVCSPARASILTGCIPSRHGVHDWIRSGSLDKRSLGEHAQHPYFASEDEAIQYLDGFVTYPDLLAENGYTCALAGKWHLGDSAHPQHGFSHWYTIGRGGCLYNQADVIEDGKLHFETRYITDLITERALDYLDECAGQENPFYISVHYTAPHDPWEEDQHPAEYIELYRNCEFTATPDEPLHPNLIPSTPSGTGEERKRLLRGYYAAVTAMDAGVGRLLDRLEAQHIRAGRVTESMCSHYDLIHTFNEMLELGADLPDFLPGRSFAPVLLEDEETDNHIVILDEYGSSRMIRTREWKYIHRYPYGPHELYHLSNDPGETRNLADLPEHAAVQAHLLDTLQKWYHAYADPAVDGTREAVTGFGQLRRPGIYSGGLPVYDVDPKYQK